MESSIVHQDPFGYPSRKISTFFGDKDFLVRVLSRGVNHSGLLVTRKVREVIRDKMVTLDLEVYFSKRILTKALYNIELCPAMSSEVS